MQPHMALPLAPTINQLDDDPRRAIGLAAELGFRHVQLNAAGPGLRPRELDQSARRDLLATLRRHELALAGFDLWIPLAHFDEPGLVDRAVSAIVAAIELCADCGRVPLSVLLPPTKSDGAKPAGAVRETIGSAAARMGVRIADHAVPIAAQEPVAIDIGIDPAAVFAAGLDPVSIAAASGARLVSARLTDVSHSGSREPLSDRGGGRLDAEAYAVALSIAGYGRPVVLDARGWSDPSTGMKVSKSAWDGRA